MTNGWIFVTTMNVHQNESLHRTICDGNRGQIIIKPDESIQKGNSSVTTMTPLVRKIQHTYTNESLYYLLRQRCSNHNCNPKEQRPRHYLHQQSILVAYSSLR